MRGTIAISWFQMCRVRSYSKRYLPAGSTIMCRCRSTHTNYTRLLSRHLPQGKKQRDLKSTVQELSSYYGRKQYEQALLASSSSDMTTSIYEVQTSSDTNLIWVFNYRISSYDHIIPDLSSRVLAIGHHSKCRTTIVHCPTNLKKH